MRVVTWVFIAALVTLLVVFVVPPINYEAGVSYHVGAIERTTPMPYAARMLVPLTINAFVPTSDAVGIIKGVMGLTAFTMTAALLLLHTWLKTWDRAAWLGVILALAMIVLMFRWMIYSVNTPLEVCLIMAGLLLLRSTWRWRYHWYAVLIVVACVNRETGAYLVITYALYEGFWRRNWTRTLLYGIVAASVIVAMRAIFWTDDYWISFDLFYLNTHPGYFPIALVSNLPFILVFALALVRLRRADPVLRRLMLFVALNYAMFIVWGSWQEVRLLMPALFVIMPVVAPVSRSTLATPYVDERQSIKA